MEMTIEERAEKIYRLLFDFYGQANIKIVKTPVVDIIATELLAVVEDGFQKGLHPQWSKLVAKAKAEAYEDAAMLVQGLDHCDMNGHSCTQEIADAIRAKAKEVLK